MHTHTIQCKGRGERERKDLIKFTRFFAAKETIKKKRQPMEWEEIVANDGTDEGLISKIYKKLIQQQKPPKNPIEKWSKYLNRRFTKEDI